MGGVGGCGEDMVGVWSLFTPEIESSVCVCDIFETRKWKLYEFVFQENVCVCVFVYVCWNFGMLRSIIDFVGLV